MGKTAFVNARIEPTIKARAETIFQAIGISASDAVAMFYRQVILRRGLPFDACIPNEQTLAAFAELDAGRGEVVHDSTEQAFDAILKGGQHRRE
jgi:DNA-damage-inducible protein J